MNKKWENPKLESLNLNDTECGRWKFVFRCNTYNGGLGCSNEEIKAGHTQPNDYQCPACEGTMVCIGKWWSPDYCDGTCS